MKPIRIAISVVATLFVMSGGLYMGGYRLGGTPQMDRLYSDAPDGATKVLFIGNGHTLGYDVPGQVQHLGQAGEAPIFVDQVTQGGATLEDHWKAKTARERITEETWDFVVLQEQSTRPVTERDKYFEYLGRFASLIERQGATPVIYATWERARWNKLYKKEKVELTPTTLRAGLEQSFRSAEAQFEVRLAPVGMAWLSFRRKHPAVPLHADDGNQASVAGAYLAASVLYGVVSGQKVSGNGFVPDAIEPDVASALQEEADQSRKKWVSLWRERQRPPKPTRVPAPTRGQAKSTANAKAAEESEAPEEQPPRSALEALRQKREAEKRNAGD